MVNLKRKKLINICLMISKKSKSNYKMEINMKKLIVFLSVMLIVGLTLIFLLPKMYNTKIGSEINFPTAADETIFASTKIDFDAEKLNAQIGENSAFVYVNPKLTDYKIVSDFGFDINDYTLYEDGTRFYKSNGVGGEDKFLKIDQFGCFTYITGVEHTSREITLTEKECFKIAKQYLKKYGLFSNRIGQRWSTNESTTTTDNGGTIKLEIGINFFPKKTDGLDVGGNSRISVDINANGEVCSVIYNWREYEKKEKVKLISMEEAFERFKEGKAFIEVENPSSKLVFEKVSLAYWTQDRNLENLVMQPVYVFQGVSYTKTGEVENFSITVQANKFN